MTDKHEENRPEPGTPSFQMFNLETMSGVHPGSRTAIMQRIRLWPRPENVQPPQWARLLWYTQPPSCVLYLQAEANDQWQSTPLLHLSDPQPHDFVPRLQAALAKFGWQLLTCGSCRYWQRLSGAVNVDNLPLGYCRWERENTENSVLPEVLRQQSALALACPAWAAGQFPFDSAPAKAQPEEASETSAGVWTQIKQRVWKRSRRRGHTRLSDRIVERSGVGAGTEPCFACQGRIANLAALTVSTEQDDKRTFSLWRCRRCHTFYLNDWIDRWERLDSLETEERYFRLAPAEAGEIFAMFEGVAGGEHPSGRHHRTQQREWLEAFLAPRTPLSHQIRQGR